jgi:hypothetical protein
MDKMKQKKLLRKLYQANLENNQDKLKTLYRREIENILEKRKAGKTRFSGKWFVTDES